MLRATGALLAAGKVSIQKSRLPIKAALAITDAAAARLKELMSSKEGIVGVKIGVKQRGCNGYSYTMNYAETKGKFDEEVQDKGVKVFIEPSALMKIVGTTMDWKEDDLSAEFVFSNPNAKSTCGCNESFSV